MEAYPAERNVFHGLDEHEHQEPQGYGLIARKLALDAVEWYNWEFLACNLLLFAQNLEVLSVKCFRHKTSDELSILSHARKVQTASGNASQHSKFGLRKLHSIHLSAWGRFIYQRLDVDNITSLLQMPSLVRFSCQGVSDEKMLNNISSRVFFKSLTLTDSQLSSNDLDSVVRNCNNLERVELGYSPFGSNSELNPPRIFRSLLHLQATLTSLIIVDEDDHWSFPSASLNSDSELPLPCLSGFTKLRTLELSSQLLLGRLILETAELKRRFVDTSPSIRIQGCPIRTRSSHNSQCSPKDHRSSHGA